MRFKSSQLESELAFVLHTHQILRHFQTQSPLGLIMYIHLTWTQMLTGTQQGILTNTKWKITYIPNTWWTKVRQFLQHIQGRLDLEVDYTIPPLQMNDVSIMDAIRNHMTWTPKQLRSINAARLYLQITYLSELTTSGTHIAVNHLHNQNPQKWSRSKLKWPTQPNPSKQVWRLWRKAL